MRLIKDADFPAMMKETILPEIEKRRTTGKFERIPGEPVYYEHLKADHPKAAMVIVHGFTEGVIKFYETAWYFLSEEYEVFLLQQRGHGLSYRYVKDLSLVHIPDYSVLPEDVHAFVENIVKPAVGTLPRFLFAHSMGGGVGALTLERYPEDFEKAVLNSPMLEMNSGSIPVVVAEAFARFKILTGHGADYMPGAKPFDSTPDLENSCTTCKERYDWYHALCCEDEKYQMCASSIGSALSFLKITREATNPKNCANVKAKVLLFQAELDNMVNPGGQEKFIRQIADGELIKVAGVRHEIYREKASLTENYWKRMMAFYSQA